MKQTKVPEPKSGKGLLLDPDRPTAEESKLVNLAVEKAWSYDDKGNVIDSVVGKAHQVTIPDNMLKADYTVTHSHPLGGSFSFDDLYVTAMNELREMRIIGHQGRSRVYLYRFKFASSLTQDKKLQAVSRYTEILAEVQDQLKREITSGKITAAEAKRVHFHQAMEILKSELRNDVFYRRIPL